MELFAALILPNFALQAVLRREPELQARAVGLLQEEFVSQENGAGPRSRHDELEDARRTTHTSVSQVTTAAHASGVVPGMTVSQAQARCPELLIRRRAPEAERSAQAALLEACFSLSSFVEETASGVCTVELVSKAAASGEKGVTSHVPQTPAVLDCALTHLAALGLHVQIGVAPNADLARLAAQSAAPIREIASPAELANLPIEGLAVPSPILDILRRWGVRTLGAFVALGREALAARLGPEVLPLYDRAAGQTTRPLRCVQPAETFEESIELEHEIETVEPLLFILRRLLEAISRRLEAVYRVAAELTLRLGLRDGSEHTRVFHIPSPTHQVEALFRMLHTHLENFTAEHPIIRLQLIAQPTRPARQQFGLFESALRDPNQFAETLARLVALLGHERVGTPELEPSHRPDAFRLRPADFTSGARSASAAALPLGLTLRRFRPPQPAQVELGDGPRHVHAAAASGPVTAAYGPMLLSGDWWATQPWSRREWDVQLAGGRLCRIFEHANTWFLEGIYD